MKNAIWLISPPASGKTTLLLEIFAQLPSQRWIFLSPLRALAEEFYLRVKDIIPTQMYWRNSDHLILPEGLIIVTPEQVDQKLVRQLEGAVVIVDEIHLWDHWGNSFRPVMWEAYFSLTEKSPLMIHLTATVNAELTEWIELSRSHFDEIFVFDYGNNQMKYSPQKTILYPLSMKSNVQQSIKRKLKQKNMGVRLVFCAYREEVRQWKRWCDENGLFALCCVGGEARAFQQELALIPHVPDVIISTTVLSHGVNLPEITGVYFTYQVKDQDFWLQMVTRGGRRGQSYEVITFDKQFIKASRRPMAFFAMVRDELITKIVSLFNTEGPWNLKASSPPKSLIKNAI